MDGRRISAVDRAGVHALIHSLRVLDLDSSARTQSTFPGRLRELVGGAAAVVRPVATGHGWSYEYVHSSGPAALERSIRGATHDVTNAHQGPSDIEFALYDPLRPDPAQRNTIFDDRVLRREWTERDNLVARAYVRHGLDRLSHLRVLVCDGPMLLAWVGAFRDEAFGSRERNILGALLRPLRRRLRIERMLGDARGVAEALGAALDEIASPAFVVTSTGAVEHANRVGREAFDRSPRDVLERIRERFAARDRPVGGTDVELGEGGSPARFVIVLREESAVNAVRIARAREVWRLTPRETEVLEHLARGEANKDIATKLGCHEGSVERHVTSLLRKAKCDSRSRLVARFWTLL